MNTTYHQRFRESIQISVRERPSYEIAFKSVEYAIEQLNTMLQKQLEHKQLYQPADLDFEKEAVVVHNPVIVGIELRFLRDIGRFDGCTGEIHGKYEDRYHAIILDVAFQDP